MDEDKPVQMHVDGVIKRATRKIETRPWMRLVPDTTPHIATSEAANDAIADESHCFGAEQPSRTARPRFETREAFEIWLDAGDWGRY